MSVAVRLLLQAVSMLMLGPAQREDNKLTVRRQPRGCAQQRHRQWEPDVQTFEAKAEADAASRHTEAPAGGLVGLPHLASSRSGGSVRQVRAMLHDCC